MFIEVLKPEETKKVQELALGALVEFDRICRENNINYALYGGSLIGAVRHNGFIPWDDDVDVVVLRSDYNKLMDICRSQLNSKYFWQSHETDNNWYRLYAKIRVNNTIFKELAHCDYNIHHGVYIDIFPLDPLPEKSFLRKIQYYKFKFWNAGVSCKYINIKNKDKKGRILARIARFVFLPFSLSYVYKKAEETATLYTGLDSTCVMPFMSAYGKREIFPKSFFENTKDILFEGHMMKIPTEYDRILRSMYGDYLQLPPEDKRVTRHRIVELSI